MNFTVSRGLTINIHAAIKRMMIVHYITLIYIFYAKVSLWGISWSLLVLNPGNIGTQGYRALIRSARRTYQGKNRRWFSRLWTLIHMSRKVCFKWPYIERRCVFSETLRTVFFLLKIDRTIFNTICDLKIS